MRLESAFVRAFCDRYREAWNSRDPARVIALAAPEVVWEDPTIPGGRTAGHAGVRTWLVGFWRAFPDMTFEPIDGPHADALEAAYLSPGADRLIVPWRCTGHMLGPIDPPGVPPTGRRVALTGVDLYDFRDGLLTRVRTITDLQAAAEQLGLAPPRDGWIARTILGIQTLRARLRR